jgi:hypothetical protein
MSTFNTRLHDPIGFQFGLSAVVPCGVDAAWGARLIYPAGLLYDRQGFHNWETPAGEELKRWLNQEGALSKALTQARRAAKSGFIHPDGSGLVILFRDGRGIIVADPNRSYGYLYVAAWLHDGNPERQAPSGTLDLTHRMKGMKA